MSSSSTVSGFFSSTGTLLSKADPAPIKAAPSTDSSQTDSVIDSAVASITDAAVTTISSRLNVGSSGFDSGVAENVASAVRSALQNLGRSSDGGSATTSRVAIGGSFQNSILKGTQTSPTPVDTPTPGPSTESPSQASPPSPGGSIDPDPTPSLATPSSDKNTPRARRHREGKSHGSSERPKQHERHERNVNREA